MLFHIFHGMTSLKHTSLLRTPTPKGIWYAQGVMFADSGRPNSPTFAPSLFGVDNVTRGGLRTGGYASVVYHGVFAQFISHIINLLTMGLPDKPSRLLVLPWLSRV